MTNVSPLMPVVGAEIKRMVDLDRRLLSAPRSGLEFLLSMGLLVQDAGDRASALHAAVPFCIRRGAAGVASASSARDRPRLWRVMVTR